jgi:uncharacterized Ntn-hydrolase superfamily protein
MDPTDQLRQYLEDLGLDDFEIEQEIENFENECQIQAEINKD